MYNQACQEHNFTAIPYIAEVYTLKTHALCDPQLTG